MKNSYDSTNVKIDELNLNISKLLEAKEMESKENKKGNNLFKLCFCA